MTTINVDVMPMTLRTGDPSTGTGQALDAGVAGLPDELLRALEHSPTAAFVVDLPERRLRWHNAAAAVYLPAPQGAEPAPEIDIDVMPLEPGTTVAEVCDQLLHGCRVRRYVTPADPSCPAAPGGHHEVVWVRADRGDQAATWAVVHAEPTSAPTDWVGAHRGSRDPLRRHDPTALVTSGCGRVQSVTRAACGALGRDAASIIGSSLLELADELGDGAAFRDALAAVLDCPGARTQRWAHLRLHAAGGEPDGQAQVRPQWVVVEVDNRVADPAVGGIFWDLLPMEVGPVPGRVGPDEPDGHEAWSALDRIGAVLDEVGIERGAPVARRAAPLDGVGGLTEREREVYELVVRGLRQSTIAERLSVSPSTVRTHISQVCRKLRVRNPAELMERLAEAAEGD